MIIINIIILYFIQITHTDEFPSTGTWLVYYKYGSAVMDSVEVIYLGDCVWVTNG